MSNINKQFEYLGINSNKYDYTDKEQNVLNHVKYMLNRSSSMFKYHNLPETIPEYELEKILQCEGFSIIGKIDDKLYALYGGLGGVTDVYYRPTQAVVSVPYLNYNATWDIDKNCIVILNDDYGVGLLPMYYRYCTMLTENEISLIMSSVNKRVQFLISASDDNTVASANSFIKNLYGGKLSAIADEKLFDSLKMQGVENTSSTIKELIEYEQYLIATMFNEIGLCSNNNMKKERLTKADIELNSDNLYPLVDTMLRNRKTGVEKVNAMFGTKIEVELNSSWDYRAYNGESIHNTEDEISVEEIEEGGKNDDN